MIHSAADHHDQPIPTYALRRMQHICTALAALGALGVTVAFTVALASPGASIHLWNAALAGAILAAIAATGALYARAALLLDACLAEREAGIKGELFATAIHRRRTQ